MSKTYQPEDVIQAIAQCSATTADLAGVDAQGIAGNIISTLSANPELIGEFLENPSGTLIDRADKFRPEHGALNWLAQNGQIVSPAQLRAYLGKNDH